MIFGLPVFIFANKKCEMTPYKKLLIKQRRSNGTGFADGGTGNVIDTQAVFGCVCADTPSSYLEEGKEPASRDWYDEDGEDVFMPTTTARKISASDWETQFLFVASNEETLRQNVRLFKEYLYGRTNENGISQNGVCFLAVYDEYTGIGYDGVYVKSISSDSFIYDDGDPTGVAELKVTFRVTNPQQIVLSIT